LVSQISTSNAEEKKQYTKKLHVHLIHEDDRLTFPEPRCTWAFLNNYIQIWDSKNNTMIYLPYSNIDSFAEQYEEVKQQ
jgi:hypothetical protein